MAIELPPWLASRPDVAELIEQHGRMFLAACFRSGAHLNHFLKTGDVRRPDNVRRAAARAADPVAHQREFLRQRIDHTKRGLRDAERKLSQASVALSDPYCWNRCKVEQTVAAQKARITERTAALKRAETDLELFDLFHTRPNER